MGRVPPIVRVDGLLEALNEFGDASLRDVRTRGFRRLMDVVEAKAVELTPVDTGNLEASTSVEVNQRGKKLVGSIRFGAPYAATVHEFPPNKRGPRTREKPGNEYGPAGPKYLERVIRGFQERLSRDMGEALREAWGRASGRARRRRRG